MVLQEIKRLWNNRAVRASVLFLILAYSVFLVYSYHQKDHSLYINERNQYLSGTLTFNEIESTFLKKQIEDNELFHDRNFEIINNNQKKLNSPLFANLHFQIEAEISYYQALNQLDPQLENTFMISTVLNSPIYGLLGLLLTMVSTQTLFYHDVQATISPLYESTRRSLKNTYFSKMAAFLVVSTISRCFSREYSYVSLM